MKTRIPYFFLLLLAFALSPGFAAGAASIGADNALPAEAHGVYPLTADPPVWIDQRVTASDGAAGEKFGSLVALDGNTAFVSALDPDAASSDAPAAVYVFTRDDGQWHEAQKLTSSDGATANFFGIALALDGDTALVGAPAAAVGVGGKRIGAVYVFTRTDGQWSESRRLVASDGTVRSMFGLSVALDGNTALVGAPYTVVNGALLQGVAYIFNRQDGNWSETQKIEASDGAVGAAFSISVALDGSTALVGATGASIGDQTFQGAAYVFTEGDTGWSETQKLTSSDGAAKNHFGNSVALEGGTAVIGAKGATIDGNVLQGAAYVFTETNNTWSQTQKLVAPQGKAYDRFGSPVLLDGDAVLIGASGMDPHGVKASNAYLFATTGGDWSQAQKFTVSDGVTGLALDSGTALIGSPNATIDDQAEQGAAHFYGRSNLDLALSAPEHISPDAEFVSQVLVTNAGSAASPAVAVTAAVPAAASFVSANATQGECSEDSGVVSCELGSIAGNAGVATANVTLKAAAAGTIRNTASVARAIPAMTASRATVIAENNAPVAEDGSLTTDENTSASGTLQASDPDGDSLTFMIVDQPAHGEVVLDDPATGAYSYTPAADYSGSDSFTFKAADAKVESNVATVTITVKAVEPPPDNDGGGGGLAPFGLLILVFAALVVCAGRRPES